MEASMVEALCGDFVARWAGSPFGGLRIAPWSVTGEAERHVRDAVGGLGEGYRIAGGVAVHATAVVEASAVLKAPVVIGPRCFVAATAYLRGGVFLEEDCIVGPACELKSSFMFRGAKVAHLSFVGDSILGAGVNVEAGAIVANYRNECEDKTIRFRFEGSLYETGVEKFGALIGDGARIGANAVIAPGALVRPGGRVGRLELLDLRPREEALAGRPVRG